MAIYEYRCDDGHVTETMCTYADRPAFLMCGECGSDAHPVTSVPAGFKGVANTKPTTHNDKAAGWRTTDNGSFVIREKGSGEAPGYKVGRCLACANKNPCIFIEPDGTMEDVSCDHCGSTSWEYLEPERAPSSVTYPHFNKGLGCWVESPGHLRDLMREQGVTDADPRDIRDAQERANRRVEEQRLAFEAEQARTLNQPGVRRYLESQQYADLVESAIREAQSKPATPDFL